MLLRWLFSLAASCYIVAALVVLPAVMAQWRPPAAAWWAAYLLCELVVLGVPLALALAHFGMRRLTAIALLPVFAFFVIPIGCWVWIRGAAGEITGWSVFAVSGLALSAVWAFSRRQRKEP